MTPLHVALHLGYLELAKWLLDNGADVNAAGAHLSLPTLQRWLNGIRRQIWYDTTSNSVVLWTSGSRQAPP